MTAITYNDNDGITGSLTRRVLNFLQLNEKMVILEIKKNTEQINTVLLPPTDIAAYKFPFQPYDIQYEFMNCLYQVIEEGKVGIFESPTGTVRSS